MFRLLKTLLILAVFAPFTSQAELFKGTATFFQDKTSTTAPVTVLIYSSRVQGTLLSREFGTITLRGTLGKKGSFRAKVIGSNGARGVMVGSYKKGSVYASGTLTFPRN